jgi:hypothetical protein
VQANDLLILLRRAPAGAAAPRQQQRQAQPARAAASTAGNPAAFNPDGSAVNPEALMQMLEGNPQQLETLPPELVAAVRAKDVAGLQVGAAWLGCGVVLGWMGGCWPAACTNLPATKKQCYKITCTCLGCIAGPNSCI